MNELMHIDIAGKLIKIGPPPLTKLSAHPQYVKGQSLKCTNLKTICELSRKCKGQEDQPTGH